MSRVHLVFDLCEEPHPRVNVPPGTVCDYDMEQGLLCQYPDGSAPVVMPPAQWIDAHTAAAEGQRVPAGSAQEDNGTGYFAGDDALGSHSTSPAHDIINSDSAPLPVEEHMAVAPAPEQHAAAGAHPGSGGGLSLAGAAVAANDAASVFGTIGNGQASTWVTAAMHPQSSLQFA